MTQKINYDEIHDVFDPCFDSSKSLEIQNDRDPKYKFDAEIISDGASDLSLITEYSELNQIDESNIIPIK